MEIKQINLKLPINLVKAAESYVKNFGYRNIQELASESIRQKIFEKNNYDETFAEEEINVVDNLIENIIKNKKYRSEKELKKILKNEI